MYYLAITSVHIEIWTRYRAFGPMAVPLWSILSPGRRVCDAIIFYRAVQASRVSERPRGQPPRRVNDAGEHMLCGVRYRNFGRFELQLQW